MCQSAAVDVTVGGAAAGGAGKRKRAEDDSRGTSEVETWTPTEVDAFFEARLGPPDAAFEAMRKMQIGALEELQGIADQISAGAENAEAQKRGLDWSVRIGCFIA